MDDFDTTGTTLPGSSFSPGLDTFSQGGVATATASDDRPQFYQEEAYGYPQSGLYTVAFLVLLAIVFGLPLFY